MHRQFGSYVCGFFLTRYIKLLQRIGKTIGEHAVNRKTVSELFMETAGRYPNKTAIIFEEQKWTFRELDEFTNRVANHFRSLGLQKGDCVALFADNCPEFIGVWLGLGKIGAVSAFVNSSLRLKALIHCIRLVTPRAIVFHSSLSDAVQAVLPDLDPALSDKCYCICGESSIPQAKSLEAELEKASAQPPPPPPDKSFQGCNQLANSPWSALNVGSFTQIRLAISSPLAQLGYRRHALLTVGG